MTAVLSSYRHLSASLRISIIPHDATIVEIVPVHDWGNVSPRRHGDSLVLLLPVLLLVEERGALIRWRSPDHEQVRRRVIVYPH